MTKIDSNSSKLEQIYHEIFYDEDILKIYKEIEKFENENKGWAYHNFEHVKNVIKIVESLLKDLGLD